MLKDLSEALSNMQFAEGTPAVNKLVWDTIRSCMDSKIRAESNSLSEEIKQAQKDYGSHSPVCGELTAAEILAKIGMLLNEKEE